MNTYDYRGLQGQIDGGAPVQIVWDGEPQRDLYIGDFPPTEATKGQKFIVVPQTYPAVTPSKSMGIQLDIPVRRTWRPTLHPHSLALRMDLPGVKHENCEVWVKGGRLHMNAKREDSLPFFQPEPYHLDRCYDHSTGEARLELGILTVTFQKAILDQDHTIIVKGSRAENSDEL